MAETAVQLIQEGKDITEVLTDSEKDRLLLCEDKVKQIFTSLYEGGMAIAEIYDNRYYREYSKKFGKYCVDKLGMSKGHAHRLMDGARAINVLKTKCLQLETFSNNQPQLTIIDDSPKCTDCKHKKGLANRAFKGVKIPGESGKCTRPEGLCEKHTQSEEPVQPEVVLPMNEAQTRPLTRLKNSDDQVAAWNLVLQWLNEGKKLTSGLVGKAVKEVQGETVIKKTKKAKKAVDNTALLSPIFSKQYQVMLDIISAERNSSYATSSPKEMVKALKNAVAIIEMDM